MTTALQNLINRLALAQSSHSRELRFTVQEVQDMITELTALAAQPQAIMQAVASIQNQVLSLQACIATLQQHAVHANVNPTWNAGGFV